jgi:hypothetical protein
MTEIRLLLFSETILQLFFCNHTQKVSPCFILSHNLAIYGLCITRTPNKHVHSPTEISEVLKKLNSALLGNLKTYPKEYGEEEACNRA